MRKIQKGARRSKVRTKKQGKGLMQRNAGGRGGGGGKGGGGESRLWGADLKGG